MIIKCLAWGLWTESKKIMKMRLMNQVLAEKITPMVSIMVWMVPLTKAKALNKEMIPILTNSMLKRMIPIFTRIKISNPSSNRQDCSIMQRIMIYLIISKISNKWSIRASWEVINLKLITTAQTMNINQFQVSRISLIGTKSSKQKMLLPKTKEKLKRTSFTNRKIALLMSLRKMVWQTNMNRKVVKKIQTTVKIILSKDMIGFEQNKLTLMKMINREFKLKRFIWF